MGIRFSCPNGHRLNVKEHLAGKRGICPSCGAKFVIPAADQSHNDADPGRGAGAAPSQTSSVASPSGAPSIVIALADAPPSSPPAAPAAPVSPINKTAERQAESAPPMPVAATNKTPFVASHSDRPAPSVSKYVAHRIRSRRLQTKIAIALLIAVVVLGILLVWVLTSGSQSASVGGMTPVIESFATATSQQPAVISL
jgi:hypothetical protein